MPSTVESRTDIARAVACYNRASFNNRLPPVTKIRFYTGAPDKLRAACLLSNKAMQSGLRVMVSTPDEAMTTTLDKMLWTYPGIAFMPHGRTSDPAAATLPVLVDHLSDNFPHHDLLISLHPTTPAFFSRFEHLVEIVGLDDEDKRLGRERFALYRNRGYELQHFDLSQNEGV